ncbi:MAG TPA: helix-turn-helix domain-containing protein [Treponemataceae bacterium]|nr:helix-turn-helix domain-containing protein [Treponemataceae bacterium]HPS44529.1 helix-turn-helix domain-containing protein [Treponemataceae bacterium]
MTIYEQIQKSVDFVETRVERGAAIRGRDGMGQGLAAREAGMSARSFVTWFWAVTGLCYREYALRRRLDRARRLLAETDRPILDVALDSGYRSHEGFTRAFRDEFGLSPQDFRKGRPPLKGLERITLIRELYMGVIIKDLPDMTVAFFDGFAPESETKAHAALDAWLAGRTATGKHRRIFGHNIDRKGNLSNDPQNEGYRLLATVEPGEETGGAKTTLIRGGKFLVTGIEGNIASDPSGAWITEGWKRMGTLIAEKHLRPHRAPRWFEEELEPSKPGNLRLDLYLEIGE